MPHPIPAYYPGLPTGYSAEPIEGGYRIKTVGDYNVDVVLFGESARISLTHLGMPYGTWDAVYCYYGPERLRRAVYAANEWDGSPVSEPAGYDRVWRTYAF